MSDVTQEEQLATAQLAWRRLLTGHHSVLEELRGNRTLYLSPENLKQNRAVGHTMEKKLDSCTRIFGHNINGIRLDSEGGDFTDLCGLIKETNADIVGITEHCLDPTKHYVSQLCHDALRRYLPRSKLTFGSSPIRTENTYKAGGTLTISAGNVVCRLSDSGSDELGRWTYQSFAGRNTRTVTFITAYQVCLKKPTQRGKTTAAAQQESLLRQRNESDPNPRKHFRKDLTHFLSQLAAKKHEILLIGDFNEALGDDEHGMSMICSKLSLTDLMTHHHGPMEVATYSRGRKRLDYALGTIKVLEALRFCGYEPFYHRMFSDHRSFFLDFDTLSLFGSDTPELPPMAYRDIQSRCPKQVTSYLWNLHKQLLSRNCFSRIDTLDALEWQDHNGAATLDADMTQFCKSSAKTCRQFREPEWSTPLIVARNKVNILKRALAVRNTGYDINDQICQLQAETGTTFLIPDTIQECNSDLRVAQQEVRQIARDCLQSRLSEFEEKIAALELSSSKNAKQKALILKHIRKAEELKRMFKKLGNLRQGNSRNGLSILDVPSNPTDNPKQCKKWRRLDLPSEIEAYILERNEKHFGQAAGPWTESPLSKEVDYTASTVTTELILSGEYDASALDNVTQLMIQHLQQWETPQETLSLQITDDELVSKLKTWKESTTTSPSSLHLGHWKALTARHSLSHCKDSDECIELDNMQRDIRRARLQLINYALRWGYLFPRWQQIINVMILKDAGCNHIHRLRVIHIYEADYNLILGIKWRATMHDAADKKRLNLGQYGRHGRSPMEPVFIEEMESEISRSSRKSLIKFDNDATSCYDRILVSVASITSRKFGLHKHAAFVMARTLEGAKYRLKTELGISDDFYQHSHLTPIHGTGQGSQNSPAIWCLISSVLFDCFDTKANGATFESPNKSESITIYMIGFVDDSTGQANDFCANQQPPPAVLLARMQHDAQLWNDLLWTSGGDLELPKCSYHVYHWIFTEDGSPILQPGRVGDNLILQSGDRSANHIIPSLSAHTAHKTLGHWKDPAGNQEKRFRQLQQKSDSAATFIQCSPLDRREAWTYFFAIYLPSIGYVLPNCFFTFKRLDKLQRKAFRALFSKCGFNRNTKRAILYGPMRLGGSTFRHLYTVQGVGQIVTFLKSWRSQSQAGTLLRIAVAWAQYALGTGTSFLLDVSTELPHMEVKWLRSLREYLHHINGKLEIDIDGILPIQRINDGYIMDFIIDSQKISPTEIRQLNYCRMYLQALTLSDITRADGVELDYAMLYGHHHPTRSSKTKMHHFTQGRPSDNYWKLWLRANLLWSDGETLTQPLGAWLVPHLQQRQTTAAYYNRPDHSLYLLTANSRYRRISLSGELTLTDNGTTVLDALPPTALPTMMTADAQWIPSFLPTLYRPPSGPAPGTFRAFLDHRPAWEASLFHSLELLMEPFALQQRLINFPFSCTSDGSVRYNTDGSFGWALSFLDGTRPVHCSGPVFGHKPTSYRAEGYGLLAMIRFLICLSEYCCDTNPLHTYKMASDNISLIDNVKDFQPDWTDPSAMEDDSIHYFAAAQHTLVSDWDILNEIRLSLPLLHRQPELLWVKGHQDRKTPYQDLSLLAQLNVDADRYAGEFQDQHGGPRPKVPRLPHNRAQLHINGATITYQLQNAVRYADTAPALQAYIQERCNWSDSTMQSVDWDAHGQALQRGIHNRIRLTKLVHDILPTNDYVHRFIDERKCSCPTCDCDSEDRDHLLRCKHPSRRRWRSSCILHVRKTTEALDTKPYLQSILLDGLSEWLEGRTICAGVYPSMYGKLIRQQTDIGWRQLFNGRLSSEWSRLQDDYLSQQHLQSKTRTGSLWTTSIITSIWSQFEIVWELRNGVIHGKDNHSRNTIRRQTAVHQLNAIYNLRDELLPSDRVHLFDTVEEHLTLPTTTILNWVTVYKPMFTDSIRKAKKQAVVGVRAISEYMLPPLSTNKKKKKKKMQSNSTNATGMT